MALANLPCYPATVVDVIGKGTSGTATQLAQAVGTLGAVYLGSNLALAAQVGDKQLDLIFSLFGASQNLPAHCLHGSFPHSFVVPLRHHICSIL
jgi:hypothetical protein